MAFEHLLFYQHNVQVFLLGHVEKYQGVIVPLSVATAFKDGTDGFIRALCKASAEKVYMIDPRSALFQAGWDRKNKRDAHRRMAAQLGKVALDTLDADRAITIDDLTDDAVEDMVRTSLAFQLDFGQQENAKLKKYAKLAGVTTLGRLESPRRLVPPYFQFSSENDPWYLKTMEVIGESQRYLKQRDETLLPELCPVLHVRDLADAVDWGKIAGELSARNVQMVFLYPNNLHEADIGLADLQRYRDAVKSIVASGVRCYTLHGGYFAMLLSKHGLAGFGNGIGYGEWRDSGYHRGGQANIRIYVPKLHRFVQANEVQFLLEAFGEFIAEDSDLLSGLLSTGGSALAVTTEQANNHFLDCRAAEAKFVAESDVQAIKADLVSAADVLATCKVKAAEAISQKSRETLLRWAEAL